MSASSRCCITVVTTVTPSSAARPASSSVRTKVESGPRSPGQVGDVLHAGLHRVAEDSAAPFHAARNHAAPEARGHPRRSRDPRFLARPSFCVTRAVSSAASQSKRSRASAGAWGSAIEAPSEARGLSGSSSCRSRLPPCSTGGSWGLRSKGSKGRRCCSRTNSCTCPDLFQSGGTAYR